MTPVLGFPSDQLLRIVIYGLPDGNMDGSKPDLLVGIDFGMTCTGKSVEEADQWSPDCSSVPLL